MKKNIKKSLFVGFTFAVFSIPFNSFAGWDYKSVESLDKMDGRTYIVSHCEDKLGDDCNMPGSATRMDISVTVEMLEGFGIIRKMP
ncbi:hypothetical protein [Algoriphagus marinus]|uniref:hypothetical protein n=1 Tax=Algoriphagus marinus TaxID=1925762 RepID=UPI00094BA941|nr:hypothetical protein [Algoriphagus marinus]